MRSKAEMPCRRVERRIDHVAGDRFLVSRVRGKPAAAESMRDRTRLGALFRVFHLTASSMTMDAIPSSMRVVARGGTRIISN